MGAIGLPEILIIAAIATLIFGPSRLPKLGRSIGETIREFRNVGKELTEAKEDVEQDLRGIKDGFSRIPSDARREAGRRS